MDLMDAMDDAPFRPARCLPRDQPRERGPAGGTPAVHQTRTWLASLGGPPDWTGWT
ncbi:MAG: hypothetical protein ACO38V_09875 [Phycisphaerales bacterium]|jgi:hypothetical protein